MLALFLYQNPPAATPMQNKLILRYLSRLCLIIKKLYGNACFHIACLFSLKFLLFLIFSLFSSLALSTTSMTCIKHDRIRHIITSLFLCFYILYDVSVKSINCVCARTNKQFILIDTPNTENGIKWCEYAILWEFEVFEDCGNCIAMEQSVGIIIKIR